MAFFVVQKPFNATGEELESGRIVSDEGWLPRRSKTLCEQRYLRPCTHEELTALEAKASTAQSTTSRRKAG